MTILVCPLSQVTEMIGAHTPERIVSLLDPDFTFPEPGPAYVNRHLRLAFHDIHVPTEALVMPSAKHIDDLLAFLGAWERTAPILVHCRAGIGRSTATAYIAACLLRYSLDKQTGDHPPHTVRHNIEFTRPRSRRTRILKFCKSLTEFCRD